MGAFPGITTNLGDYVADLVRFLDESLEGFFDFIYLFSSQIINAIEGFLLWMPWWVFILLIVILGWYFKSMVSGVLYGAFVFLIGTFGLWEDLMTTIAIVMTAVIISLAVGIPSGVWMAFSKGFSTVMRPILDAMQTMPSFVYLIPAIFFFGLGNISAIFATLIYAVPPVIRLTELAIRSVDREVIESAQSFGSSNWQMLFKIQLPQALPTIMAGVNQTTMMALAMVVIASMVGAQGLGEQVLVSINQIDIALGFEAGISIVFLAIIIDRITGGVADKLQKHRRVS
ncbi:glycine betaine/proline transport system permease protein [Virgibacillus subterraneus]|uniref:Glycine betaine/proline transport system permease protein n=2 Tax=Virgibacillus TaxID=84406 RepID=A0A1H1E7W4_9BACI|nr:MULTISPECIES: proline/glycine betaine ABC transporter permease [Virgibacillus]SDQ84835.1 glycine betaine/proline transport system permease protein [Virgibacillus salinus]SEQ39665.1 glycine betaine/proline transport system permease protein [Virgibacillus subterraneus]